MKILVLILHTFRELIAKLTLIFLAGISTIAILGILLSVSAAWSSEGVTLLLFGNPASPPVPAEKFVDMVRMLQAGAAGGLFMGVVLFGVFATAGVIPDTLERGTVDLYLSKPIARWQLLLGRYLGGVGVVLANILYFIGALWLIMGIRLGVWNIQFFFAAFTMSFVFAVLFAIVTLVGVASRNTAIAIISAFLYLMVISAALYHRESSLYFLSGNSIYRGALDGLYYLLPQTSAMQDQVQQQIVSQSMDWRPFAQSLLSSTAIFFWAAFILKRKDF